jgi:hypothetical protein
VVAAVVALPYLAGGYVWDDGPLIVERLVGLDAVGWFELWAGPVTDDGPGASYYRPVALSLMALGGRFGPWAIHLMTLLLHAGSAGLVVLLCRHSRWPLIAGLVFAVHPLASEVLGWCSAMPDALAVFLGLLAVWWRPRSALGAFVLLVLGGFSKETALLIPLVFAFGGSAVRVWLTPWLGAVLVVGSVRLMANVGLGAGWGAKLGLAPTALGWGSGGLLWPFPMHAVRDLHVAPMPLVVCGWVLLFGLVVLGRGRPLALAAAALVFCAHVLALPAALDGYLMAERYSYPAILGLGIWLAAILPRFERRWAVGVALVFGLGVHIQEAGRWQTDLTLFASPEGRGRSSSYAWHLLAVSQMAANEHALAAESFGHAVSAGNPYPGDRRLRLTALVLAGRSKEAVVWMDAGPAEGLLAVDIAWRARAAWDAGQPERAKRLLSMLKQDGHFDGPPWIPALAKVVFGATEPPLIPHEPSTP